VLFRSVVSDRGVDIPDGVDIAVSDPVAASSIPLAVALTTFNFTPAVTLVALTDYFILIEQEYTANNADYISVHHQNTFLTNGQLFHFGDGLGMDWQNHPGTVDLNQAYQLNPLAGMDVAWTINRQDLGIPEVSPDITALVQAQIDAPNYTLDSGIIVAISRVTPTSQQRIASSNVNPTRTGPILRITYEEPVPPVIPDKLADPTIHGRERKPKLPHSVIYDPKRVDRYRIESIQVAQTAMIEYKTQDAAIAHLEGMMDLVREQALKTQDIIGHLEHQLEAIDFLKSLGKRRDDEFMVILAIMQTYF